MNRFGASEQLVLFVFLLLAFEPIIRFEQVFRYDSLMDPIPALLSRQL